MFRNLGFIVGILMLAAAGAASAETGAPSDTHVTQPTVVAPAGGKIAAGGGGDFSEEP